MVRFLVISFLLPMALWGANPAFNDFNANQFGTGGNRVVVKSGASLTNTAFFGSLTLNGGPFSGGGGGSLTNLTLQGDLLSFDGTNLISVPVGADGSMLRAFGSSVGWSFNGSALQTLNASQLSSGTVPDARLLGANPVFTTIGTTGSGVDPGSITLLDTNGTHSVRLVAPNVIVTNINWIYPDRPATGLAKLTVSAGTNETLSVLAGDGNAAHYLDGTLNFSTPSGSGGLTNLTTQGDLLSYDGSTLIRVGVGADGTMLRAFGGVVGWSFDGSLLQSLNAAQLTAGTVPDARLNGANPTFASLSVTNTTAGAIRLSDTNNTHSVRFVAPDAVVTNVNFILPDRPSTGWLKVTLSGGTNDTLAIVDNLVSVGFTVDGGGSVIATGKVKGFFTCPYAGTITAWNIVADTGTVTIKCWKIATGTAKPTAANSINTSGVALSSGTAIHSTTLSDFTSTAVSANDIFAFNIESISGATELSFNLQLTK